MAPARLFATASEARFFLQAWVALEILFAAWAFAIAWHPDDSRSMILFAGVAICLVPFHAQLARIASRRGTPWAWVTSPSLQWELMHRGPYQALRSEGLSRSAAVLIQVVLVLLPVAGLVAGALL